MEEEDFRNLQHWLTWLKTFHSISKGRRKLIKNIQGESAKQSEKEAKAKKAKVKLENLRAGKVSNSSGIFCGKNVQFTWISQGTLNSGFGTLGGLNNKVYKNMNVVYDNDLIDTPIDAKHTI